MARPSLDDREIEEFRREICEVALRLFAEDGYESVTMRAIADEAGCSPAKPYSYFDDKEAILAATRARCFHKLSDYIEERLDGTEDPEEALRVQTRHYLEFARSQPHAFQIMFALDQASAREFPEIRSAIRRSWGIVRGSVQEAIDAGVIDADLGEFAELIWSGIHGIATLELAGTPGPEWDSQALVEPMLDALIAAHQPTEDSTEPTDAS